MTAAKKAPAAAEATRDEVAELRALTSAQEAAIGRLTEAVQEAAAGTYDVEVLKRESREVVRSVVEGAG